ncbi:hypothetical protein [Helicobacter sp. UBA3407]|uniref:hypothetical protein n=1 Tax=Helicobacter TaxID=209 RepID=UPI00262A0F2E|nr:hypothetical protein [Helicobacter sp. UBA3407]
MQRVVVDTLGNIKCENCEKSLAQKLKDSREITIKSLESKTILNQAVENLIM